MAEEKFVPEIVEIEQKAGAKGWSIEEYLQVAGFTRPSWTRWKNGKVSIHPAKLAHARAVVTKLPKRAPKPPRLNPLMKDVH